MKNTLLVLLLSISALLSARADDGLPTLLRSTLDNESLWKLETALTGHRGSNGAVLECTAAALSDLLLQAGCEATVENLVQVLTSPSEKGTPASAIKELLLPRAEVIQVSQDGSVAVIITPVAGGESLEIFRDTAYGLTVHQLKR